MIPDSFDWKRFHAYRVFDAFLERFLLLRKSFVTKHPDELNLASAFEDIRTRFVADYDDSKASFEDKVVIQFDGASEQTKIVFANVEFLWAMPMENIKAKTKREYVHRWFPDPGLISSDPSIFVEDPHTIADPGPWYLRNKYFELVAGSY